MEARERAGLSQRALAELAETAQSVVARIELGATSPSWATLTSLVEAAGYRLEGLVRSGAVPPVPDLSGMEQRLALTPRERLREIAAEWERAAERSPSGSRAGDHTDDHAGVYPGDLHGAVSPAFDPERMVQALAHHAVRCVIAGAVAARLHGAPGTARALEIIPSRAEPDLERLSAALRELDARMHCDGFPEGLALDLAAARLARGHTWQLITSAGRLDLRFTPQGSSGYDDIVRGAERFWFGESPLFVARLRDLIRLKEATDSASDRDDLRVLRAVHALRP